MSKDVIYIDAVVDIITVICDDEIIETIELVGTDTSVEDVIEAYKERYPKYDIKVRTQIRKVEPVELVTEEAGFLHDFKEGFKDGLDNNLFAMYGRRIEEKDYPKLRKWLAGSNIMSVGIGIGAGAVFGKTMLTGAAIGAGAFIVSSIGAGQVMEYKVKQLNK